MIITLEQTTALRPKYKINWEGFLNSVGELFKERAAGRGFKISAFDKQVVENQATGTWLFEEVDSGKSLAQARIIIPVRRSSDVPVNPSLIVSAEETFFSVDELSEIISSVWSSDWVLDG